MVSSTDGWLDEHLLEAPGLLLRAQMFALTPLRRASLRPWFRVIARVGEQGLTNISSIRTGLVVAGFGHPARRAGAAEPIGRNLTVSMQGALGYRCAWIIGTGSNGGSAKVTVDAAVQRVIDHLGGLDILVNNAGIGAQGTVESATDEDWQRVLEVNVIGTARVSRAAWPHLRDSAIGSIVNVSSIAATAGLPQRAVYSASKGAVLALTLSMAADGVADGIRVNAVNPGTADTPWVTRLLASADDPLAERAALEARQPSGRLVSPDEVASAVVYLAAPTSSATTGTWIAVDGGMAGLRLRPKSPSTPPPSGE